MLTAICGPPALPTENEMLCGALCRMLATSRPRMRKRCVAGFAE
jgi:hypothetical protein